MNTFLIYTKLLMGTVLGWFSFSPLEITNIDVQRASPDCMHKLQEFESSFTYPFSETEEFRIEHGADGDYFAFFKSLGTPYYYVATCKRDYTASKVVDGKAITIEHKAGEIAAAICLVLRKMKSNNGQEVEAWYICDLKVNPRYQNEHIPLKLTQACGLARFYQCGRGYAICMNPPAGDPKAARIAKKHGPIKGVRTTTLNLYTLTADQMNSSLGNIRESLISHGYIAPEDHLSCISTQGTKDYTIFTPSKTDHRPWNLLHLCVSGDGMMPQEGATHMICALDGTALDAGFRKIAGNPSSTAQILSYGMDDVDFNRLTSNTI